MHVTVLATPVEVDGANHLGTKIGDPARIVDLVVEVRHVRVEPALSDGDGDVRMAEPFSFADILRRPGGSVGSSPSAAPATSVPSPELPPNPFGGPFGGSAFPPQPHTNPTAENSPAETQGPQVPIQENEPTEGSINQSVTPPSWPANSDPPSEQVSTATAPVAPASVPPPSMALEVPVNPSTSANAGRPLSEGEGGMEISNRELLDRIMAMRKERAVRVAVEKEKIREDAVTQEAIRAIEEEYAGYEAAFLREVAEAEAQIKLNQLKQASTILLEAKRQTQRRMAMDLADEMAIYLAKSERDDMSIRRAYVVSIETMYRSFAYGLINEPLPAGWRHTWEQEPIEPAAIPGLPYPVHPTKQLVAYEDHPVILYSGQLSKADPQLLAGLPFLSYGVLLDTRRFHSTVGVGRATRECL